MPKALITGLSGMDASHLADLLLDKNYEVFGTIRKHSNPETEWGNSSHLKDKIKAYYCDLTDPYSFHLAVKDCMPDEVYLLAAQSHVGLGESIQAYTLDVNATGILNCLEEIRQTVPNAKVYFAASSECFGNSIDEDGFQRETTPLNPVSIYAIAKTNSYHICQHYRNGYGLWVSCGILFNHCSERRGVNFVTQKIVRGAVNIKKRLQEKLTLGNIDSFRDDGNSRDYVRAMWMMLQHNKPDNFVIATSKTRSVREFADIVFKKLSMDYRDYIVQDPNLFRKVELNLLKGDASKAHKELGWYPEYSLEDTIDQMIAKAMEN